MNYTKETLSLSAEATATAMNIILNKESSGLAVTKTFDRDNSIEWHFDDGSFVEIEVLRDFNDNMNPVAVVVKEWIDEPTIDSFYTIISREKFELK